MSEPSEVGASAVESEARSGSAPSEFAAAMRRELDRRIADLAETGDDVFGRIGRAEWALMILVSVAIPLALVWWFA